MFFEKCFSYKFTVNIDIEWFIKIKLLADIQRNCNNNILLKITYVIISPR